MIRFNALGIRFSLPLLTLIFPFLASRLGMQGITWPLMAAIGLHELAHLAAARFARVHISEIRLMPFGGSARIENPYRLPARQLLPVALAGPLANLLLAILIAACAHWGWINASSAANLMLPNIILLLFNLLPALPLDGGRIAFCLLNPILNPRRALKVCIWAGRALSMLLMLLSAYSGFKTGKWNLSFLLAAVFILASAPDERSALSDSAAQKLSDLSNALPAFGPAQLYLADAAVSIQDVLSKIRPREHCLFVVCRDGVPQGLLDGRSLLMQLIKSNTPEPSLGAMQLYSFSPSENSGAAKASSFIHPSV